jgi:molybdopterin-guanine dinucleotide biosynthesis protein A
MIEKNQITAMVLAGGRGSRMGGADKGLQKFNGTPLALHALMRLQLQQGALIGEFMLNANRNLAAYEAFGVPVWPDSLSDFAGPLAGFLSGLERAELPYLLTVPCDVPRFPADLVQRLAAPFDDPATEIAMVSAPEDDGQLRPQPVFCLMRVDLLESLMAFTQGGGRKIDRWTEQHRTVLVPFDQPGDDPRAFANTNTLEELHRLEQLALEKHGR